MKHLLKSLVECKMRRMIGKMMDIANAQPAVATNIEHSGTWYSTFGS